MKFIYTFKVVWLFAFCGIVFSHAQKALANPPQLYASTQKSPRKITLNWINPGGIAGYTIYRTTTIGGNADGTGNWGSSIANLPGNATSFLDANVTINVGYEYRVTAVGVTNKKIEYIYLQASSCLSWKTGESWFCSLMMLLPRA